MAAPKTQDKAPVEATAAAKPGMPPIVTNTTNTACVLGGVVLKPGENKLSSEEFNKARSARGYERRVEIGVLEDQVERPKRVAEVVAAIGLADSIRDLDPYRSDERLPVQRALEAVEHILSAVTPKILTTYTAEDCIAVLNGRIPKRHPLANPAQKSTKVTPGDPHPAVARACRKRLKQLGVRLNEGVAQREIGLPKAKVVSAA